MHTYVSPDVYVQLQMYQEMKSSVAYEVMYHSIEWIVIVAFSICLYPYRVLFLG